MVKAVKKISSDDIFLKLNLDNYNDFLSTRLKREEVIYINFEDRNKLFNVVQTNSPNKAYKEIKKYLKTNLYRKWKFVDGILKKIFKEEVNKKTQPCKDELFCHVYTSIKHDIIRYGSIEPEKYHKYDFIDEVLEMLRNDGILGAPSKNISLYNYNIKTKFSRVIFKEVDLKYKAFTERESIYKIYFSYIYDILLRKGSLEFTDILRKIRYCKEFELEKFLNVFSDIFEVNEIENIKIVSVKIDVNPFNFL